MQTVVGLGLSLTDQEYINTEDKRDIGKDCPLSTLMMREFDRSIKEYYGVNYSVK